MFEAEVWDAPTEADGWDEVLLSDGPWPVDVDAPAAEAESLWVRWGSLFEPGPTDVDVLGRVGQLEALGAQLVVWQARELARLRGLRLAEQHRVHGPRARAERLDRHGWVPSEVGFALGLSENQVRRRLDLADALERYPAAAGLLERGRVPAWTGTRLLEHLDALAGLLSSDRVHQVEAATVAWLAARPRTVTALNARMRRLLVAAQAEADAAAAAAAECDAADDAACPDTGARDGWVLMGRHAQRRVAVSPLGDGTAEVWALLPEVDALAVAAALDAAVPRLVDLPPETAETRTRAQRRADRLVAGLTGTPACYGRDTDVPGHAAAGSPAVPMIELAVPVGTLAGGHTPGAVSGYGPVHPASVRDLAADPAARTRGLLYDPTTGWVLGLAAPLDLARVHWLRDVPPGAGRSHPPSLAAAARARDHTCRAPGCTRPARTCDLDHTVPWPDGPTTLANTGCLCRYHHRLKTHAPRWTLTPHPGVGDDPDTRDLVWTTPTGRRHTTSPHDHRPDDLPDEPPF
jgi:hypothetical protein